MSDADPQIPPAPVLPPRNRPGLVGRRFASADLPDDWSSPLPRRSATSPSAWDAPTPASPPSAASADQSPAVPDAADPVPQTSRRGWRYAVVAALIVAVAVAVWFVTRH